MEDGLLKRQKVTPENGCQKDCILWLNVEVKYKSLGGSLIGEVNGIEIKTSCPQDKFYGKRVLDQKIFE